jgi:hypothetical protein
MNTERWQRIATTFESLDLLAKSNHNLSSFLYNPNPKTNLEGYYWVIALLTTALIFTVIILMALRQFNRQLRQQVIATQQAKQEYQHERDQLDAILSNIAEASLPWTATKSLCRQIKQQKHF